MIEDEVVISGISGRFPKSNNLNSLKFNLEHKVDMIDTFWKDFHPEGVTTRFGALDYLEKFDSSFFSIPSKHANWIDPQIRILIEKCYEAIIDAGVSPQMLIGSNTGVFVGCNGDKMIPGNNVTKEGYAVLGYGTFNFANRISHVFGFNGLSMAIDTACSSSAYALQTAFESIKSGKCDAALVGGAQLYRNYDMFVEFNRLNVLAKDGVSRPFDMESQGYVKGEAISAIFLQKSSDALRVYATVVNIVTNNDGFKEERYTYPSTEVQIKLLSKCYENFDLNLVNYIEAHATGTIVGDKQEVNAIDEIFKKRSKSPLTIGSIKSNMGHSESTSTMCALAKTILMFENSKIFPNLNLKNIRTDIEGFASQRIKVSTNFEDFHGNYIGINSFGLGGANAHILVKKNTKNNKIDILTVEDNLPRLVVWSGRSEEAVDEIFEDIISRPLNFEYIALIQSSQSITAIANSIRGFGIFHNGKTMAECLKKDVKKFDGQKRSKIFVYSGMGSQWLGMGKDLMKIPVINETIQNLHKILEPKGINLLNILTYSERSLFNDPLNSYVGIIAIEIALSDLMRYLNIEPDFIIGHSVGELGCAYADGCLSAEETILAAYERGIACSKVKNFKGAMAAVGMSSEEIFKILPKDIDIACYNSPSSVTISGPYESIQKFVEELEELKVFAKEIESSGVAFHSRYIADCEQFLIENLRTVIKNPKIRSEKWISSTYSVKETAGMEYKLASPEYFTKNLLNSVFFKDALEMLPKNSITIEVSPHGLMKTFLKEVISEGVNFSLSDKNSRDGAMHLFNSLGSIFQAGVDMNLLNMYPQVKFPVSRGTPMIAPLIKWNHKENFFVPKFDNSKFYSNRTILMNLNSKEFKFLENHIVDGKRLVPAAYWIYLVWETFTMMNSCKIENQKAMMKSVKFHRATVLKKNMDISISICIQRHSGKFEILEDNSIIVSGSVSSAKNEVFQDIWFEDDSQQFTVNHQQFYSFYNVKGFNFQGDFKSLQEVKEDRMTGKISWNSNWVTFIDGLIQFDEHNVFSYESMNYVKVPTGIKKLLIDPIRHLLEVNKAAEMGQKCTLKIYRLKAITNSGGIEIHNLEVKNIYRRTSTPNLEVQKLVPFFSTEKISRLNAVKICLQIALERKEDKKILRCIDMTNSKPNVDLVNRAADDIPLCKIHIESSDLTDGGSISNIDLLIMENISGKRYNDQDIKQLTELLSPSGIIVSIDSADFIMQSEHFQQVSKISTMSEVFNIFRIFQYPEMKNTNFLKSTKIVEITEKVKEWLHILQNAMKFDSILIYAYNKNASGILGFFNCLLKEYQHKTLKCILIDDNSAPKFDLNLDFYDTVLSLGYPCMIYRNKSWGMYRYVNFESSDEQFLPTQHIYVDCLVPGDLASIKWYTGSLNIGQSQNLINVKYSSLNFKDVMLALGKIQKSKSQRHLLGFEFSGVDRLNRKIMGIRKEAGAFTSHVEIKEDDLLWEIPSEWTLEDAASVPLVYFTAYYAFFGVTKIEKGKKILIHSGSGGVGQAAIQISLAYGLNVFTTVGSDEKKNFLLENFPNLMQDQIGSSRNCSFVKMVISKTNGRGVDFVLNSLSGELLKASIECLCEDGEILEIGRFDIQASNELTMDYLENGRCIKAVNFDNKSLHDEKMQIAFNRMSNDLRNGIIKPINYTVFEANNIQEAFRFMSNGKHIGKVIVKLPEKDSMLKTICKKFYSNPDKSYIVIGGLGGFGLELITWMIERGCRKIIVSSVKTILTPYQTYKMHYFKVNEAKVVICRSDLSTKSGCIDIINEAAKLGPVDGIFNLAIVARDALFENLTNELFEDVLIPKARITQNLHEVSMELCKELNHFVVFSSVSCGRGNPGQSNYGLSNSIMERIVEKRKIMGLPGKAIQWGPIADVGYFANNTLSDKIFGMQAQKIFSCLRVLDDLLTSNDAIVSSVIVAEKQEKISESKSLVDKILNVLGIKNRDTVSLEIPLGQFGMDSLMITEIHHIIERELNISMSVNEIRTLPLKYFETQNFFKKAESNDISSLKFYESFYKTAFEVKDIDMVLVKGNDIKFGTKTIIIPGLFGLASEIYVNFAGTLKHPATVLQFYSSSNLSNLDSIIEFVTPEVIEYFQNSTTFILIGHSFGTSVALKLALILEKLGKTGIIISLNGAPDLFISTTKGVEKSLKDSNEINYRVFYRLYFRFLTKELKEKISRCKNSEKMFDVITDDLHKLLKFNEKYVKNVFHVGLLNRFNAALNSALNDPIVKLKGTKILLVKAKSKFFLFGDSKDDYGLGKYSDVEVKIIKANSLHLNLVNDPEVSKLINDTADLI